MSDDEINAAIAESIGWSLVGTSIRAGRPPGADYVGSEFIPNYCADLNAMHEAEKVLDVSCRLKYPTKLLRVLFELGGEFTWYGSGTFPHITATARQRAEAFLRTLGKWKEAQP